MADHFIFIFYIYLFILSTIGYGFIFSKFINKELFQLNIGYQGIVGFFFLSLISMLTSYFVSHNFIFNSLIHLIGLSFFLYLFFQFKNKENFKLLFLISIALWIGAYVFKNHDDFPYYHLTYSLNLSQNSFIIGTGIFSHGFRTFSSLFYYHSLLYLPYIEYYLFHIGPFLILLFFNCSIIINLRDKFKKNQFDFIYFYSLISLVFINIVFYRIAEHGTDRSAQILLILIFLFLFEILYFQKDKKNILLNFNILLIIIFLASGMKAIYYLYLLLIPVIFYKKKILKIFFVKKNYLIIFFLSLSLLINFLTNFLNTGCFLYPSQKTCIVKTEWSIPKEEVKLMANHYEWWAKAGGGPGYKHELSKEEYVKKFNWLSNWVDRYFFNKISDTLFGLLTICLLIFVYAKIISSRYKNYKKDNINYIAYLLPLFFLVEWFLNHPAMRYGGYVLIALPIIIFTSSKINKFVIRKDKIYYFSIFFILIGLLIYNVRNIQRLDKEMSFYKYDIKKSPYFYVDEVKTIKVHSKGDFQIFSTLNNKMCWAAQTPCSYHKKFKSKNFLWMKIVSRDDK